MNFIIYKSSAGSGKTFTLTKEYLMLALSSDQSSRYKHILAITFTNKAAQEMKTRVIKMLGLFSEMKNLNTGEEKMRDELSQKLNISKEVLQLRARNTLFNILHHYTDFNITTIDKFIVRIVRSFNMEMKLPFQFEIEMDFDLIKQEAYDRLIQQTGKDKEFSEYLFDYIKDEVRNNGNVNFEKSLLNLYNNFNDDSSKQNFEYYENFSLKDYSEIRKYLQQKLKDYENTIASMAKVINSKFLKLNIDTKYLVQGVSNSGIHNAITKTLIKEDFPYIPNTKTIEKFFETNEWAKSEQINQDLEEVQKDYQTLISYKNENYNEAVLYKNIQKSFFAFTLLNLLNKEVLLVKAEKNIAFLSEFNDKINEFVLNQPIPFIYEKIGEKFKNYLIDEFQDTSITQWQNLLPLIENSLAYNQRNIIVGDVKQAIYRWRGGDVDQFQELPKFHKALTDDLMIKRYNSLSRHYNDEIEPLINNWRSLPNVIDFNNSFFEYYIGKENDDGLRSYYKDVKQNYDPQKKGGYASITLLEKRKKDEYDENEVDITTAKVIEQVNDAVERGYNYRQIAVLTRKNDQSKKIAEALTINEIPIKSSESLSLTQSPQVIFILSIYKILFDKSDLKSMVNATDFLIKNQGTISFDKHEQHLNKNHSYDNFIAFLQQEYNVSLPNINALSTYEIIEEIIRLFKLNTNDPFIQTLLNLVIKKNKETPADFIEWWENKKEKLFISISESYNAVTLLTIHKSKGLEFDLVIVPFVDEILKIDYTNQNYIWTNVKGKIPKMENAIVKMSKPILDEVNLVEANEEYTKIKLDNLNMLYVALTRAGKEINLIATKVKKNNIIGDFIKEFGENDFFEMGEKLKFETEENEIPKPEVKLAFNSDWREKVKISYSAPAIWNVPENSEENFNQLDPRKFGNLIHLIFSEIDLDFNYSAVIQEFYKAGLIEKAGLEEINMIFKTAAENKELNQIWKNGEHLIEKEIITEEAQSYRPDRILKQDGNYVILDFKTGESSQKDNKQVRKYLSLLSAIKNQPVKGALYYTQGDKLVWV